MRASECISLISWIIELFHQKYLILFLGVVLLLNFHLRSEWITLNFAHTVIPKFSVKSHPTLVFSIPRSCSSSLTVKRRSCSTATLTRSTSYFVLDVGRLEWVSLSTDVRPFLNGSFICVLLINSSPNVIFNSSIVFALLLPRLKKLYKFAHLRFFPPFSAMNKSRVRKKKRRKQINTAREIEIRRLMGN